jgi:hypothetical protein
MAGFVPSVPLLGAVGGCNGLTLDTKNGVLFAACARSGNPLDRTKPMMLVLSAKDGKVLAFSAHGNGR